MPMRLNSSVSVSSSRDSSMRAVSTRAMLRAWPSMASMVSRPMSVSTRSRQPSLCLSSNIVIVVSSSDMRWRVSSSSLRTSALRSGHARVDLRRACASWACTCAAARVYGSLYSGRPVSR